MKYVLYALLAWFLYQFIFKLVIPVYLATRKIKKGFREMHEKMNAQQQAGSTPPPASGKAPSGEKKPAGDYIDFEEVSMGS